MKLLQYQMRMQSTQARLLAKTEGVFAGVSSGAILFAATEIAKREENKGKRIVAIVCDTGEDIYRQHYMSNYVF